MHYFGAYANKSGVGLFSNCLKSFSIPPRQPLNILRPHSTFLDTLKWINPSHAWQRGSGYSVVLSKACASRHRTGTNAMDFRNEDMGCM